MKRLLYAAVPPFALFGPLFIVQSIPGLSPWRQVFALMGGFMVGLAVVAVALHQREMEARLNALDRDGAEALEPTSEDARTQRPTGERRGTKGRPADGDAFASRLP